MDHVKPVHDTSVLNVRYGIRCAAEVAHLRLSIHHLLSDESHVNSDALLNGWGMADL
jgi:hypothetical protein